MEMTDTPMQLMTEEEGNDNYMKSSSKLMDNDDTEAEAAAASTNNGADVVCSLCDYQFTRNTAQVFDEYSEFDHTSLSGSEADDVLRVFLADKNERSLRLELCPSCKDQCQQLLETGQQLSLLVDLVTTLLLQNSRFTLIHPKQTIIAKLFSDTNLQEYYIRSRLHWLDPLGEAPTSNVDSPDLKKRTHSVEIRDIDREIEELETQFHIDRVKSYEYENKANAEEHDSNRDTLSMSSSLCSSLPSLVSLDSCSSAVKDALANNIMNVNISALESSGSNGVYERSPVPKSSPLSKSPKNLVTSITNLIANTTNDELDVCFSNKIQKMKMTNVAMKSTESESGNPQGSENIFRLPLPPRTSILAPSSPAAKKEPHKKPAKSKNTGKRTRQGEKRYTCSLCPKTWDTKRDLDVHVGSHLKVSNYVCDICGAAYRHKSALKTHVALHKGDVKYKCDHCQKHFTQKSGLERHQEAIHTNARNYICTDCGRSFRYHSSFNLHKQSHKETPDKKFRCALCDQSFFTSYHLKRHVKTHTGDKPYKCSNCGKGFAEKYNLDSHRKTHLKDN